MRLNLGQFQDAFINALFFDPPPDFIELSKQPGFLVYRNTVLSGCVDALRANFPTVETLVGVDWMNSVTKAYVLESPPCDGRLIRYGAGFPAYLNESLYHHRLPYLMDIARLDFAWIEAFSATCMPHLQLNELTEISAADLMSCSLTPRASAKWLWFDRNPSYNIWRHCREEKIWSDSNPWEAEGVLLTGSNEGVSHQALSYGGCIFLDACAKGDSIDSASAAAENAQPGLDFTRLLTQLLQADVFCPLNFLKSNRHD